MATITADRTTTVDSVNAYNYTYGHSMHAQENRNMEPNRPTAAVSVREIVNDFMNGRETSGFHAVAFLMDYASDYEDEFEASEISIVGYRYYSNEVPIPDTVPATELPPHDGAVRSLLLQPALLRISEERLPPLGRWLWRFDTDTLTHLGD